MKIVKIEDLHCDAGWRDFSFLKITTDDGIVGWSEYNEGYGSAGLTAVIRRMAAGLIGQDPRPIERIMTTHLRHHPPGAGRHQPAGDGRDRERAARRQGQGARHSGLRAVRRPGARPPAALLVALRQLPLPQRRDDGRRAGALVRRRGEARQAREGAWLQGAKDQHLPLRSRSAQHAPAGLWPHRRRARAQRRRRDPRGDHRRAGGLPPGRRPRHGHPSRHQLQLQDRGLHQGRAHLRALQSLLARDRFLRSRGAAPDPRPRLDADRLLRIAVRPPPVPAVLREPLDRRVDHRRAVERAGRIPQDLDHGRGLRDQLRAAQFLRPHVDPDERPSVRRHAQLPHHGNRYRRRAVEGRSGHASAGHREWRADRADPAGLGRRHQRGGGEGASAEESRIPREETTWSTSFAATR